MKSRKKPADVPGVRPLGARALKSARDTLRPYLQGSTALDLFAGQGRFGLAALEEGAASVTFVEKHPDEVLGIRERAARYGERARVRRQDAFAFLEGASRDDERYDIAFADPPFPLWNSPFAKKLFAAVAAVLSEDAIFLVKHPTRVVLSTPLFGFSLWKETPFGESRLMYFTYGQDEIPEKDNDSGH